MSGTTFSVEVQPVVPARLARLADLANDLYYSWDRGVRRIFRDLDEPTWVASLHNPRVFLRRVSQARLDAAAEDPIFLAEYRRALSAYDTYLESAGRPRSEPHLETGRDLVAYFSAEFGFHQSVPLYAGGLGILAADLCKAMSHLRAPFVGVGLLYRQGYFDQRLLCNGDQIADYRSVEPADLPVSAARDPRGEAVVVAVDLPGRRLLLRVWEAKAGHDIFDHALMRTYFGGFWTGLGIDEGRFLALGATPRDPGRFNMTALALRGSRYQNGVSRIHARVAAENEAYVWPEVPPAESPMGHVTNGVDVGTFLGLPWNALFDMYMDRGWRARLTDAAFWERFLDRIPNHVFQSVHEILKSELLEYARERATVQYRRGGYAESLIQHLTRFLTARRLDTLLVGFARRFATYKRATLLFRDLPRLARIVNNPERPVLFLFAGKAHPNDRPGQDLIRTIAEVSMRPELQGRVLLLEDYNFSMARRLMPGVDVWLNVPEYPMEACGTSGMKAAINGAINLSVLDGWWGEAYDGENGWAIHPHPELDPARRDEQEALELYNLLEDQIIPMYFARNREGDRDVWVSRSKASMKTVMPRFNGIRMALDYLRDYYAQAARHGVRLADGGGAGARSLAAWKARVAQAWPRLRMRLATALPAAVRAADPLALEVAVSLNGLQPEDVRVECLSGRLDEVGAFVATGSTLLEPAGDAGGGETLYRLDLRGDGGRPLGDGLGHFKVRLFPYHPLLAHRFETGRMLWLE